MKRVLFIAIAIAGCSSDGEAPARNDGSTNLDGHIDTNPGQPGSTCATACDCMPGLSCANGACGQGGAAYYCCDNASCPTGSACQHTSGAMDVCGGMPMPPPGGPPPPPPPPPGGPPPFPGLGDLGFPALPDGGLGGFCAILPCMMDSDCTRLPIGCTTCNPTTHKCE
jgi:hypothetical protein